MRVFVTGASGWVGSAVVPELIEAGHEVTGLARSDASAGALTAAGARVRRGSLDDIDSLRAGAADADGVIHLAFKHDFGDFAAAGAADLNAVQAMGDVLAGSGKPFVITSGTLMLAMIAPGRLGTEDIVAGPELATAPRVGSELAVLAMAERGVRTSIVRLSPTVHGDGDRGFVPRLIDIARDKGVAAYVGDGANRCRRCTGSTRRGCSGWRWRRRPRGRCCTPPAILVSRSWKSPAPSAGSSASPRRASPQTRRTGTSASSAPSSSSTTRRQPS
jgi:nucleoside-diphosphate-sugar epimerase